MQPTRGGARTALLFLASLLVSATLATGIVRPAEAAPVAGTTHGSDNVGLGLTPATIEQDLGHRAFRISYTLFNQQDRDQGLTVSVTALAHDLDGTPQYEGSPGAAARLRASVSHLVLAKGEKRDFVVTGSIPAGRGGLDVGVVATLDHPAAGSGQVVIKSRVGGLLLLRGPKPWKETVAGEAVNVATRDGKPELLAIVRNTGDVHQRPTGTIRVLRDGKVVGTATLEPRLILPGSARRLNAKWVGARPDLTGTTFEIDLGGATTGFSTATTIPGDLGTAPAAPQEDRGGSSNRLWLWIAGLLLLLALLLAWFLHRERHRRIQAQDDERENADAPLETASR